MRLVDPRLEEIRRLLHALRRQVDDLVSGTLISLKDPSSGPDLDAERLGEEVDRLEKELKEQIAATAQVVNLTTGQREVEEVFERALGESASKLEQRVLIALYLKEICVAAAVGQLLKVVGGKPELQLDQSVDELTAFRADRRAPRLSHPESELLAKINEGVPAGLQRRYDELVAKRRDATISEAEHAELLELTERVEELDAKRVEHLAELARFRGTPIRALMRDLGIKIPSYA